MNAVKPTRGDESQAQEIIRALRHSEIDAVLTAGGVALIKHGEVAADLATVVHQERQRLSRILHDHVQQLLVASLLKIGNAKGNTTNVALRTAAQEAEQLIREAITATRKLAADLDPPALSAAGLRGGLAWLAGALEARAGLIVEHAIAADAEPAGEDIRLLLFHACRELLLNVAKHAGTNQARLALRRVGHAIVLTVEDRGRGMAHGSIAGDEGIGLPQIRRAVERVHGTFTVRTGPSAGTTVELRVPAHPVRERRRKRGDPITRPAKRTGGSCR